MHSYKKLQSCPWLAGNQGEIDLSGSAAEMGSGHRSVQVGAGIQSFLPLYAEGNYTLRHPRHLPEVAFLAEIGTTHLCITDFIVCCRTGKLAAPPSCSHLAGVVSRPENSIFHPSDLLNPGQALGHTGVHSIPIILPASISPGHRANQLPVVILVA